MKGTNTMRESNIKIAIDNDIYSLEDAAYLFDYDKQRFLHLINHNKDGFKFKEDGPTIKRIDEPKHRKGTFIKRESDGHTWNTIKALAEELNVDKCTVAKHIRDNQEFTYNNERYTAPNYTPITRTLTKPMAKRADIISLGAKQTFNKLPTTSGSPSQPEVSKLVKEAVEAKIKQLSTEQQCFDLLKKLAIERIQNTEYDKAAKVLNALNMLSN